MKPQFFKIWIQKVTITGKLARVHAYINLDDIARVAQEPIYAQVANAFTRQMEVREIPCPDKMLTVTTRANVQFIVDQKQIERAIIQNSIEQEI